MSCVTRPQLSDSDVWVGVISSHVYWGVWGLLQVCFSARDSHVMLSQLLSVMKFDAVQVQICQNDAPESAPMDFQLCDALAPHPLLADLDL